jgi:DNA-binding HxlR family transcriptional regulator
MMSRCRNCEPVTQQVRHAADLLERRWLLQMVVAAHSGAVRFNEFGSSVVGISPRMLSCRLRDLEEAGIIVRIVVPDIPPRVEYRLTDRGEALAPLVEALRRYAEG